jgi:ABC-2 type transport system ATP-binding protein
MRRVEIARALLHRPRMLLLDEPTAGLDIKARADILKIVRGLVADEGVGALWATHLVDEIRDDDHVVLLHKGRVLADGPCRSIVMAEGAGSIGEAFSSLTGAGREEDEL